MEARNNINEKYTFGNKAFEQIKQIDITSKEYSNDASFIQPLFQKVIPKFMELAKALDPKKFNIYFTGTEKEAKFFRPEIPKQENIFDLSGQMTLDELIAFIAASDVLVAASTGPLHIAGITNIRAVGLFSSKRPIHFGRWKPLGNTVLVFEDKKSSDLSQPLDIPLRDILRTVESTV